MKMLVKKVRKERERGWFRLLSSRGKTDNMEKLDL